MHIFLISAASPSPVIPAANSSGDKDTTLASAHRGVYGCPHPTPPLLGAYWLLPIMAIVLALNILAEDFYFRAWLMPKMSWIGRPTWIVNGLLFAFYHTFQLWLLPILLLASLIFAFVVWHSKSVVPSLVLHFVLNFLFSILGMLALITGLTT
ncbi:MAG: CPBP family glutamic-type intramembrane protease [Gammaproteobacteria bacterium]|nr:CPBP family glutamic-type intramembrane protease [Gammaproteobacteria bacterium]